MIIIPGMAVTTPKFTTIIVFLITVFTNPSGCFCRCPQQESEALLSMNFTSLATLYGPPWTTERAPWTTETDCCEWDGITCDENSHVAEIRLRSYRGDNGMMGGVISDSLCKLLFLTVIDIQNIGTTGTLPFCLRDLHFLKSLSVVDNGLTGVVPPSIFMLTNITSLSLRGNQLSGSLPDCLNNLSPLRYLDLSENRLSGQIPFTWGNLSFLEALDVSFNQLSGALPLSFAGLSSLTELHAYGHKFNESNPWALPSSIRILSLSLNHEIKISEDFFHNLTNLMFFSLSNCTLNISTSWIPNFQLQQLELVSCQMDGQIPLWISTQFWLDSLTLANNGLVGEIPSWLWPVIASLSQLNISRNHLHGLLFPIGPNSKIRILDVSDNAFIGHIPSLGPLYEASFPFQYASPAILMFNDNLFTGNIPPSLCNFSNFIGKLNLENNRLDGMIPWCLVEDGFPVYDLNLGGNKLEGMMPQGLLVSSEIRSLVIRNNQLSGTFLPSFTNDTALQVLDIGHNKFTGHLPKSIGNISSLQVLVMKDNQLSGNILSEISNLKQLQILDLSSNNLSGTIPHNIVFLRAMAVAREDGYVLQSELDYGHGSSWYSMNSSFGLDMNPKGRKLHYPYILSTLTSIDLSSNQLNGDVPLDFGKLKGLMFLNLSMNNLSGIIPPSFGNMSRLESLDLSSNKFSGDIPSELQSLSSLEFLNLSNNNLSGSIPQGGQMITFENTSYSRNPNLKGCPLPKNCNWPKFASPPPVKDVEDEDNEENEKIPWYEIGLGWSFGAGFLSIVVLLISIRESWRKKYFQRVDNILKFLLPFLCTRTL